jgi:hypothetical protein
MFIIAVGLTVVSATILVYFEEKIVRRQNPFGEKRLSE